MGLKARMTAGDPRLAVAGVLTTVAVLVIEARMGDQWSMGALAAISSVFAVAVFGAGLAASAGDGAAAPGVDRRPDGPATALLVAGLALALAAMIQLADLVGSGDTAGTVAGVALMFAAVAAYPAWARRSPVATLIVAVALATAFVAAAQGTIGIDGIDTFRWLMLIVVIAFGVAAWRLDPIDGHRSVQLVNAAGIAVVVLAGSLFGGALGPFFLPIGYGGDGIDHGPLGWEIAVAVGCAALIVYALVRREAGPGWLGALSTVYFVAAAATASEEESLVGWPLVLAVLALVATAVALLGPDRGGRVEEPIDDARA